MDLYKYMFIYREVILVFAALIYELLVSKKGNSVEGYPEQN